MIYLQELVVQLAKIKTDLEKKLNHPFLGKHLPSPVIDEDKLLLLYAIFDEMDLSDELKEHYIITAMLVQIALNTHDDVSTKNDINSQEFFERQLTVLAGDYFSGLYYLVLSEVKDIDMIKVFALAIKEINEHKIKLYHEDESKELSILESLEVVETSLFKRITQYYKLDFHRLLASKFLIYKRLSHEKFHSYDKGILPFSYLTKACSELVEETTLLLNDSTFKNPEIKKLLVKRLHAIQFYESLHDNNAVEEGL